MMKNSLRTNMIYLGFGLAGSVFLLTILNIFLARVLGPGGFGIYSFGISLGSILLSVSEMGLTALVVREVSAGKEHGLAFFKKGMMVRAIATIVLFLVLICFLWGFRTPLEKWIPAITILLGFLFLSGNATLRWIFQATQRLEYEAILNFVASALPLAMACVGYYFFGATVFPLAIMYMFSQLIALSVTGTVVRPFLKFLPAENTVGDRGIFFTALTPFAWMMMVMSLYSYMDVVLVSAFVNDAAAGYYSAALKPIMAFRLLPLVFQQALLPKFAETAAAEPEQFPILIRKAILFSLILGGGIALVATAVAPMLFHLVYGPLYSPSVAIFRILVWSGFFYFLYLFMGNALIAKHRERDLATCYTFVLVLAIILNALWIPRWGALGTASAMLVSDLTLFILVFWLLLRKPRRPEPSATPGSVDRTGNG